MKTLLLLRHAKSSWDHPDLVDHDRPLNKRGKRDLPRVGGLLVQAQLVPEHILTSTAVRARKTASGVADASGFTGEICRSEQLYLAAPRQIMALVRNLSDRHQRVMLVGHNPGLESLLAALSGSDRAMPTAALGHIELDISHWSDLQGDVNAELINFWRPRDLPAD